MTLGGEPGPTGAKWAEAGFPLWAVIVRFRATLPVVGVGVGVGVRGIFEHRRGTFCKKGWIRMGLLWDLPQVAGQE